MKFLVANIGGSTGYKMVLERLQYLKTAQIPDIVLIQECGKDDNFPGLEPFFSLYSGNSQIRIHHNQSSNINNITINNKMNIIHFTTTINHNRTTQKVCFITAYRNHAVKPELFFKNIDKIITIHTKTSHKICLSGDFNVTLDNNFLFDLIDKHYLISKSYAKHKHRPQTKARQIDHILSNISHELLTVETKESLEHISTMYTNLGHPSFDITLNPTSQEDTS